MRQLNLVKEEMSKEVATETEFDWEAEFRAVVREIIRLQLMSKTVKTAQLSKRVEALVEWGMINHPRFNVKSDKMWGTVRTYIHCFSKEQEHFTTASVREVTTKVRVFLSLERALFSVEPLNVKVRRASNAKTTDYDDKKNHLMKEVKAAWDDFCKRKKAKNYICRKLGWYNAPLSLVEEFAEQFFTDDLLEYLRNGLTGDIYELFDILNKTQSIAGSLTYGLFYTDCPELQKHEDIGDALKYVFGQLIDTNHPHPFCLT